MSLKAGRVGVNPADVDPIDGHINPESVDSYTKAQADAKFSTKDELRIAINDVDLLMGSKLTDVYTVMGKNGAKNLLSFPYDGTVSGTNIFTINNDGTILIPAGTYPARSFIYLDKNFTPDKGRYRFVTNKIVSGVSLKIDFYNENTWIKNYAVNNPSSPYTPIIDVDYSDYTRLSIYLDVAANTTLSSNITVEPMCILGVDNDFSYQPPAMTNRELTVNKLNISDLKSITADASDFAAFKTAIANL